MKCVQFYKGEIPNKKNCWLYQMIKWSNFTLEADHDYIQWMFPSNEPSQMVADSPVLTKEESEIFQSDISLQEKVKTSFRRFLNFLDFELVNEEIKPMKDVPSWIAAESLHNMMRITRMFKSLRLTGNEEYAKLFFKSLKPYRDKVSSNTWNYWENAVEGELR